jgi:nucleoside-diphosphate-sugar epimerase
LHERSQNSRCVLITGGRGWIGRAVGKLLQRTGYRVISVDRSSPEIASDVRSEEIVCDITDAPRLERQFQAEPVDKILHLAAILPTAAQRDPVLATRVNLAGGVHLLEMARKFGVARFVFASSLSVYGTVAAARTISEVDRAAPEDLYGTAKLYVEQLGETYRRSHDLDFVGLRIGRVVGAGAQSMTSAWRSQIFEFLGSSRPVEISIPYRSEERVLLAHIEDVAKMLFLLLEAPATRHAIYNAPSESFLVADLKHSVEGWNPNIHIKTNDAWAAGNPRRLDSGRFRSEFSWQNPSIRERLQDAARR